MIGDYESLKKKIARLEKNDYYRAGKMLGYYCALSEAHPSTWCPVIQEMNRCPLFENEGPSEVLPETDYDLLQTCKCITRKDIYACPLYLRFTDIYLDVLEDIDD